MKDPDGRFGMHEPAFRAAANAHGHGNPAIRLGMDVPTRREVAEATPEWLYFILIDWFWECPSELIPSDDQVLEVKAILTERPDVNDPVIASLLNECDELLALGKSGTST